MNLLFFKNISTLLKSAAAYQLYINFETLSKQITMYNVFLSK